MVTSKSLWPGWVFPGIPIPFWSEFSTQVGEFVRQNNLQAANEKGLVDAGMSIKAIGMPMAATGEKMAFDQSIKGGNRIHLHFNNQIYLLTDQQWAQFSAKVIDTCKARVAAAKTIDFQTAVMLGSVIQSMH